MLLFPEHKRLFVMKTLIDQYSQPGEIVYDPFAGTYVTGRASMFLPLHCICIPGEKDADCSQFAMLQFVDVFARQLLNP